MRPIVRWMIGRIAQTCDSFIEWCDDMSDRSWHRYGPVLTYGFRACECVNRAIDRATENRKSWRGY